MSKAKRGLENKLFKRPDPSDGQKRFLEEAGRQFDDQEMTMIRANVKGQIVGLGDLPAQRARIACMLAETYGVILAQPHKKPND